MTSPVLPDDTLWDVRATVPFPWLSVSWVYRAAESASLPHRKVGARLRFVPAEGRRWADAQRGPGVAFQRNAGPR